MDRRSIFAVTLLCGSIAHAQSVMKAPRKVPGVDKPACSQGAICFSGKVSDGEEFRKKLNADLEFVLEPGWTITVVPAHPEGECQEFAWVVTAPYRSHRGLDINMTYGVTAEEEASTSPREFFFVTNCADYQTESERVNIVLWPYTATKEKVDDAMAKLGTSPVGEGRLWITDSKISHASDTPDKKLGRIEWMTFSVEIVLPQPRSANLS